LPGDASWRQLDIGSTFFGLLVLVIWSQVLVHVAAWLFPPPDAPA